MAAAGGLGGDHDAAAGHTYGGRSTRTLTIRSTSNSSEWVPPLRPEMRALLLVTMAVLCTVMSLLYTDVLSFFCPSSSSSSNSLTSTSDSRDLLLLAVDTLPSNSGRYVFYNNEHAAAADDDDAFSNILSALQEKGSLARSAAVAADSDVDTKLLQVNVVAPTERQHNVTKPESISYASPVAAANEHGKRASMAIMRTSSGSTSESSGIRSHETYAAVANESVPADGKSTTAERENTTGRIMTDVNSSLPSLFSSTGIAISTNEPPAVVNSRLQEEERKVGDDGAASPATTIAMNTTAGCNYSMGKWVKDMKRVPYYSGRSCKRWLSEMWACREMPERPTFEYESYRWQPEGCDMPIFNPHRFLERMRNKVVAFVGDSMGRQQFQSLMCMLSGGDDNGGEAGPVEDVSAAYGLAKPAGAVRPDGVAQRFSATNTTLIYYWSATLCDVEPLDENLYAMHLDRPAAFLREHIGKMEVLVLNTGHHWNRGKMTANGWIMYMGGRASPGIGLGEARRLALRKVAEWVEGRQTAAEVYLRTLSPRHFTGGDWDSGGRCDRPGEVAVEGREVVDGGAEAAVAGMRRIRLLNITYLSQYREEAHISKYSRGGMSGQDCLHWCLPGVPDVWNELLYAQILLQLHDTTVAVVQTLATTDTSTSR